MEAAVVTARPRILLVEDSEDTRLLLAMALRSDGWEVEEAADAFAGERLLAGPGGFDVLVADYDLPGKTGAAMVKDAAASGALDGTRVVIVTAHPAPDGVEGMQVVRKPLDLPRFLEQMRKIRGSAPAPAAGPSPAGGVELVLYVSSGSLASARVIENLREAILHAVSGIRFTVFDLATQPLAGEEDQIVFTPTLVKRHPAPRAWIVGDFSRREVVADLLHTLAGPAR